MVEYTLQELFKTVAEYKLKGKEQIYPQNSVQGTELGFVTVDSEEPSKIWSMPLKRAKQEASFFEDPDVVIEMISSYMGRVKLIHDLRRGVVFKPTHIPLTEVVVEVGSTTQAEVEVSQVTASKATQCYLPSL